MTTIAHLGRAAAALLLAALLTSPVLAQDEDGTTPGVADPNDAVARNQQIQDQQERENRRAQEQLDQQWDQLQQENQQQAVDQMRRMGAGASASPPHYAAPQSAPPAPGYATRSAARPAATAVLRMAIGTAGPGGFSPLAGSHIWIMRENPADALARAGFQAAPRGAPVDTLAANCATPVGCHEVLNPIVETALETIRPGPDGLGSTDALAAGSYYVVAIAPYQAKAIVWALPVTLRPGANGLRLDQTNGRAAR